MIQPVLVSSTDPRSLQKVVKQLKGDQFSWVYLGRSTEQLERAQNCFSANGNFIETVESFHQASEDLREPLLTYLYEIGRTLNSLLWWVTSLSYRSAVVSNMFVRTCHLRLGTDLVREWKGPGPLVMVVAEGPVRQALSLNASQNISESRGNSVEIVESWRLRPSAMVPSIVKLLVRRTFFALREGRRMILARWLIRRPHFPTASTSLIVSSVSLRSQPRGPEFHTFFFADLACKIKESGRHVALMPIVLRDVAYKKALMNLPGPKFPLCVPHRYLTVSDLILAITRTIRKPPKPNPMPTLAGMDIAPLIEDDLRDHWVSNRAADNLMLGATFRRLGKKGANIRRIIYVYENQPWERAICWQVRKSLPQAMLVGYQHSRAPRMMLNMHLAPGGEKEAPLPDRVVTAGRNTARMMSSSGYEPGQVRVGGAFQVPASMKGAFRAPVGGHTVLVAPSSGREEARELIDMAPRMFAPNEGIRVIIKCHPTMPYSTIVGKDLSPLPEHVEVSDQPINELMAQSSVMVYTSSTVCIHALAMELPVVHLRPRFDLEMDPFGVAPEVRLEAQDLTELREQVSWILHHREDYISQHRESWRAVVEDFHTPVTEDTYQAFIAP